MRGGRSQSPTKWIPEGHIRTQNAALGAQQGFEDFSDHKRDKQRGQRMTPRAKGGGTVTDVPGTGTACFALDFTEEVEAGGSAEAEKRVRLPSHRLWNSGQEKVNANERNGP